MAQQITIDIVAETKKLTSGIDDANKQLGGMSKQLKTAATAAAGLASAFVLKKGVDFLKDAITEAKDAELTMKRATTAFGDGSAALKKVSDDATKFGKSLAVDNDEILNLAATMAVNLPAGAKKSAAEIVNLGYDVAALKNIDIEAWTNKFNKAMQDGVLTTKEMSVSFPGLTAATYKQAEAMQKAGDTQGALNLLVDAGTKKYGDAAEKNVTASQKLDTAMANLKETVGAKLLPTIDKLVGFMSTLLDAFAAQPAAVQNVELALLAIVAVGGPLLTFLASAKTALITLGLVSEGAAVGTNLLSVAMKAIPIMAVIALIVLLIANWDDVTAAAKKVWEAVSKWFGKVYDDIKDFVGKAIDWVKENWPLLLAILTGPFGLFVGFLIKHKDEVIAKIKDIWNNISDYIKLVGPYVLDFMLGPFDEFATWLLGHKDKVTETLSNMWTGVMEKLGTIVELIKYNTITKFLELFTGVIEWVDKIKSGVIYKFNELKDSAIDSFNKLKDGASKIWNLIKDFIGNAVDNIRQKFGEVYDKMVEVGKDIARGIGAGLTSMTGWFKGLLGDWIQRNIPDWAKTILKIQSPSKIMADVGVNIAKGLVGGITSGASAITTPKALTASVTTAQAPIVVNISAGLGTDPYELGRVVSNALRKYGTVSSQAI